MATSVALDRRLTSFSAALFGLSYICPTVIFSTFGVIAEGTQGASAMAYALSTAVMLLTAVSYGRMAARYPLSGSAYAYVSRTTNATAGFITGWVLILDYFFMPMVICLFTAKALEVVLPSIPYQVWIVTIAVLTSVINVLGIKLADRINLTIMAAQLAVVATAIVLCLLALRRTPPPDLLSPFLNTHTSLPAIMSGAAIAAYSFLGFDAVTTLSEETLDPTVSIPRATLAAALAAGAIYIVTAYLLGAVHPAFEFADVDNAGYAILATVSGRAFPLLFGVVLVAFVAAVMCAQAGSSRLLYAMGREGALPRIFAYLHPTLRTPLFNIVLMGIVMLAALAFDVETATSCVNFGAFCAFTAVNLCVVIDHVSGPRALPGGRAKVLFAALGAGASLMLIFSLHRLALTIGGIWLLIGSVYWTLRRTRPVATPMAR